MGFLAQFSSILNKKNWFSFTASQYRKNQNSAQGPKLVESFQLTFSAATTWSYIYLQKIIKVGIFIYNKMRHFREQSLFWPRW